MKSDSGRSKIIRIPKRSSGSRLIYVPDKEYREALASWKEVLTSVLERHFGCCQDHAFVQGRNCATNAQVHFGKRYALSVDIEDFFDSISEEHLRPYLDDEALHWVLEDGAPRQGLPTSPVAANLAMLQVDQKLLQLSGALRATYSRYADDLTFGYDDPTLKPFLLEAVVRVLGEIGLRLNERKTLVQNAKNGALIITGVALTSTGVISTRRTRRRLRAARHQGKRAQASGLAEWARCRFPRGVAEGESSRVQSMLASAQSMLAKIVAPPTQEIDLCLFDLDNTLCLSSDLKSFRGRANVGRPTTDQEYRQTLLARTAMPTARAGYSRDLLKALRRKFPDMKWGVFTRAPRAYATLLLEHVFPGIAWDVIVAFEDVRATKPHGDGVWAAMEQCGVKSSHRVALVGGEIDDVKAAYSAGCWAILDRSNWAKPWKNPDYGAMEKVPDAVIDSPNELAEVLSAPHVYLPELEYQIAVPNSAKKRRRRIDTINHFFPRPPGGYAPVMVLGRRFPTHSAFAPRRRWHPLTEHIHENKNSKKFPAAWVQAVRTYLSSLPEGEYVLTVIPFKPGRAPRMEAFLEQVSSSLSARPLANFTFRAMPQLLAFKTGAASNHGQLLDKPQRFANIADHLYVREPEQASDQQVVVFDDVVTSGASLLVARDYLMDAGAGSVACVAMAKAVAAR